MADQSVIRARLLATLEQLPDEQLAAVLDFVKVLRQRALMEDAGKTLPDPESDPLLNYLGKVGHGSLAHEIDKALFDSATLQASMGFRKVP